MGLVRSLGELLDEVANERAEGYRRVKLKINPGWDEEPVARSAVLGQTLPCSPMRTARTPELAVRRGSRALGPPGRVRPGLHRATAGRRRPGGPCPVSPTDPDAALPRRGADLIGVGVDRSGHRGLFGRERESGTARRSSGEPCTPTTCARSSGVPVWCGGMVETGVGRAANVALAALPNFSLPGDLSASGRFFEQDVDCAARGERRTGPLPCPPAPAAGCSSTMTP